jgi:hypothetical protein
MVGGGGRFEKDKIGWNANYGQSMTTDEFMAAHGDKFKTPEQASAFIELTRRTGRAAIDMKTQVNKETKEVKIVGIKSVDTVSGTKAKVDADRVARTERDIKTRANKAGTPISATEARMQAVSRVTGKAGKNIEKAKADKKATTKAQRMKNLKQNQARKAKLDGAS